jgi:hypothetical protein
VQLSKEFNRVTRESKPIPRSAEYTETEQAGRVSVGVIGSRA